MATKTITKYRNPPKKKHHKKAGFTIPLAIIAGMAPVASHALADYKAGGLELAGKGLCWSLTGYNPLQGKFNADGLWRGAIPLVIGVLAHKFIGGKLGINRALAASGIPFVRF